jgi:hypothetical protein
MNRLVGIALIFKLTVGIFTHPHVQPEISGYALAYELCLEVSLNGMDCAVRVPKGRMNVTKIAIELISQYPRNYALANDYAAVASMEGWVESRVALKVSINACFFG